MKASNTTGSWSNTTDASGLYVIYGLLPGAYDLNASMSGYLDNVTTGNNIAAGSATEANLVLLRP